MEPFNTPNIVLPDDHYERLFVNYHHDPGSSDARIKEIERQTQAIVDAEGGTTKVAAAYEGMRVLVY